MKFSKKRQWYIWCDTIIADDWIQWLKISLLKLCYWFLDPNAQHQDDVSLSTWESKGWDKIKKKRQKKAEFNLHFKLTILFLDASTVQGSLRKPHIWGTFPLIFLLQNRRSFATPSYITQMQPKYEQKLTYLERHHKVVHQNIRGSYTPPSF